MRRARFVLLAGLLSLTCRAEVIGTMQPAPPLSEERIAALDEPQRAAWRDYLARSRAAQARDRAVLAAERSGMAAPPAAAAPGSARSMPLRRAPDWYGSDEARRIADNIASFQTPSGGWGKNADRSGPPRRPGQHYAAAEGREGWHFVATIDNGATLTELQFLAKVQARLPHDAYRVALARGVQYLLDAQYPNGGWPQVYPLEGGYHDAITLNDDAMADVLDVLQQVAGGEGGFADLPASQVQAAGAALARGVELLLAAQVRVAGVPTGWCQQHDMLTLAPAGARDFEPAALASHESAHLLLVLMRLPQPSPALQAAIHGGVAWLRATALADVPVRWARYYEPPRMRPVFGDRDRTIHDTVRDLSEERQRGYAWFSQTPARAIAAYAGWCEKNRAGCQAGP